jgi:hypothetical protein
VFVDLPALTKTSIPDWIRGPLERFAVKVDAAV